MKIIGQDIISLDLFLVKHNHLLVPKLPLFFKYVCLRYGARNFISWSGPSSENKLDNTKRYFLELFDIITLCCLIGVDFYQGNYGPEIPTKKGPYDFSSNSFYPSFASLISQSTISMFSSISFQRALRNHLITQSFF